MSDVKQVKVDNWGIYFLQRLKHFFNRTDYCDLTLQFQDNAQLKVHRLVLSACTEYFELLERTCEMYEDCLVMPDDLQADVVVPIVNFMYTGQLEFRMELLERLYQTSLVMNMPVLSKLLYAHRQQSKPPIHIHSKPPKPSFSKNTKGPVASSSGLNNKRTYSKAFEQTSGPKIKKVFYPQSVKQPEVLINHNSVSNHNSEMSTFSFPVFTEKTKPATCDPRPTRYELPEELDEDNIFDNSFTSISYTSKPLMIHPNSVKQYSSKTAALFEDVSTSKRFFHSSTSDIVECKKITSSNPQRTGLFDEEIADSLPDESEMFQQPLRHKEDTKSASQLFDQILDSEGPKLTIEGNDTKTTNNIDHAKIISEVLKKYPHLVKSNKNIKLKIVNTSKTKKKHLTSLPVEESVVKPKQEPPDFTYESDVIDSKQAAMLIGLGAENIKGPWICLICGTPGKALHFTSYYKFRRHLVEVHNEKPIVNMCEYCGMKSFKRNCLFYHLYTKHDIPPPSNYHFPKCNVCNYVALTEALLVRHKLSHAEVRVFRCNACASKFSSSSQLLLHIQKTGHKYSDKRNFQCIYCLKVFLREPSLYAHLKTNHKKSAKDDGIIDDSDEENGQKPELPKTLTNVKTEMPVSFDNTFEECNVQYQIEHKLDGNIQVVSKKPKVLMPVNRHKILNSGFNTQTVSASSPSKVVQKKKQHQEQSPEQPEFLHEIDTDSPNPSNNSEEIVIIDNQEFIVQNYQLVPKREISVEDFVLPNDLDESTTLPTSSQLEYHTFHNTQPETSKMIMKKSTNINQPIQIVVSNEEEYNALMNSNHSIIFDNTDANKTLTVLAGPNNRELDTEAIDLDNTQSNDMMIIPENYRLNVSESVTGDSSNIVVVYSHPVDDQSKQYQIITSQGLEAQFVQPSTIITQNYETVTTCSPDMNAHMLNTQVVESWQNTVQGNVSKLPIPCTSGIQTLQIPTQMPTMEVTSIENLTANIEELPVSISQPATSTINLDQIVTRQIDSSINAYNQPHIIEEPVLEPSNNIISHDVSVADQHQTVTPLNVLDQSAMDVEIQTHDSNLINHSVSILPSIDSNSVSQNVVLCESSTNIPELNTTDSVIVSNEQMITSNTDSSIQTIDIANNMPDENTTSSLMLSVQTSDLPINPPEIDNATNTEVLAEQCPMELSGEQDLNDDQNDTEVPETIENIEKAINVYPQSLNEGTQITENSNDNIGVNDTIKSVVSENIESVITKTTTSDREIREDIVTLASEWSEDETDAQPETTKTCNNSQETETKDAEKAEEIEESIENIQNEVQKHSSSESLKTTVEVNLSEQITETLSNQKDSSLQENNEEKRDPQEKISSLLNDWDDNDDSQEEESTNVETDITPAENANGDKPNEIHNDDVEMNNCSVIVEPEIKKDDKIKSLVSDWDEEEEEEVKN